MRGLFAIVVVLGMCLGAPAPVASAQGYPFCGPGQVPRFQFGFANLKAQLGATMGEPLECEHPDAGTGDTLQQTTTGQAFYRRSTNTPTFTDGFRHWALTSQGLVYWEGSSIDPPGVAAQPRPPAQPTPTPRPSTEGRPLDGFVDFVVGDIDEFWKRTFDQANVRYSTPTVNWFSQSFNCGGSGTTTVAAYCRPSRAVYLNRGFFEYLWSIDEDATVALVIAHEWGHHVQNMLGLSRERFAIVRLELQADCFAGMFFRDADRRGLLEPGDLDEAIRMSRSGGDVDHGTGPQRVEAFRRGFDGDSCLTYTPR